MPSQKNNPFFGFKTDDEIRAWLEFEGFEERKSMLICEGYAPACIGCTTSDCFPGDRIALVYSRAAIVGIMMERDGFTQDDAEEWFDLNIASAYVGKHTPIFINTL